VVAALPIPVTQFGLIPTFEAQKGMLATYTPLFCFLLLAYIFYLRHSLATTFYGLSSRLRRLITSVTPLLLIIVALILIVSYHNTLTLSIDNVQEVSASSAGATVRTDVSILKETELSRIPNSVLLILCYIGFFMAAESAFIFMAIKEYAQDLLKLEDSALINKVDFQKYTQAVKAQLLALAEAIDRLLVWSRDTKIERARHQITDPASQRQRIEALRREFDELREDFIELSRQSSYTLQRRVLGALNLEDTLISPDEASTAGTAPPPPSSDAPNPS